MSNFEMKDNEIIMRGLTESGEAVTIKLNIEEVMQVRNEYIKNNKEYIKKAIKDVLKIMID